MVITEAIPNIPKIEALYTKKVMGCCCGLCVIAFGILDALLTYILLVKMLG